MPRMAKLGGSIMKIDMHGSCDETDGTTISEIDSHRYILVGVINGRPYITQENELNDFRGQMEGATLDTIMDDITAEEPTCEALYINGRMIVKSDRLSIIES